MGVFIIIVLVWLGANALLLGLIALAYWRHCRAGSLPHQPEPAEHQAPCCRAHEHHAQKRATPR